MNAILIGVVGPCGAGKSTLASGLHTQGYKAKHIAQEHSYVPDMWQRLSKPDYLVYLDVSYSQTIIRRKLNWTIHEYQIQVERLKHARDHSDLFLNTDTLSPQEVLNTVIEFIQNLPYIHI
jgi:ABC-type cobalamin/Fe3+-siderophores transport system ATPase subunit